MKIRNTFQFNKNLIVKKNIRKKTTKVQKYIYSRIKIIHIKRIIKIFKQLRQR